MILGGTVGSIVAIYAGSYGYYLDLQEKEAQAAEAKKVAMAEKRTKAAAASKKKTETAEEKATKNIAEDKVIEMEEVVVVEEDADGSVEKGFIKEETEEQVGIPKKRKRRFRFWKKD